MTNQQQTIQLSLEQLRRAPWPATPVDFGTPPSAFTPPGSLRAIEHLEISADRWTCRVSPDTVRAKLAQKTPVLLHALDADFAVPVQLYWFLRHRERLFDLVARLKSELKLDARLVLPSDLPSKWIADFKRSRDIEWVEPKYPTANWRMLPHVLGLQKKRPLVLDAVASTDLAFALAGEWSEAAPVALCDVEAGDPVSYKVITRDQPLGALLEKHQPARWTAGPRWRRRSANLDAPIATGELVFFADREPAAKQSPCVRCGWCEYICPTRCSPAEFLRAVRDHDCDRARRAGLESCIDCGLCTNVCPSNLPLQSFIDALRVEKCNLASSLASSTEAT